MKIVLTHTEALDYIWERYARTVPEGTELEIEIQPDPEEEDAAQPEEETPPAKPFSHAEDCECSKCQPEEEKEEEKPEDEVAAQRERNETREFLTPIEVIAWHLPVLKLLVDLRKNKKCIRARDIGTRLNRSTPSVSESLQYLRKHDLVYNGDNGWGKEGMLPDYNSHLWSATARAMNHQLIAA